MTIHYNTIGKKRKELAQAIGKWLEVEVEYLGAPSFAYRMDYFTLDKDGNLSFDDRADSEVIEQLLEHLEAEGFECESAAEAGLCIALPAQGVSEEALVNLQRLLDSKAVLIQKALGADRVTMERTEEQLRFPWFDRTPEPEVVSATAHLIDRLLATAKAKQRVTSKEKPAENEKYAFRCFLLRLGFIGSEYKEVRKVLLRNLSGSSAFKGGNANAAAE